MDSQLGSPPKTFLDLSDRFVLAWITDIRKVDLDVFRFDFDLTFAALLMHADGTVFHRFGGRSSESASQWLSMETLTDLMSRTLVAHQQHTPRPRSTKPPRTIEDYASFRTWMAEGNKMPDCIHCHQVGEHEVLSAQRAGGFDRESIWRWPTPDRVGLEMNPTRQDEITSVTGSAAAAGLQPKDRILRWSEVPIGSITDLMGALDSSSGSAQQFAVQVERGPEAIQVSLSVADGWKRGDSRSFAWRPLKWALDPGPGFGGTDLGAREKAELGIDEGSYAFRVTYLVTWGHKRHRGQAAQKAGLREGDVVTAVNGRRDFASQDHFHAWFRLHVPENSNFEVEFLRDGERRRITLKALP